MERKMARLPYWLVACALALTSQASATPLMLEVGQDTPRDLPAWEQVQTMRPMAAGPYRPRVVLDLDKNDEISDLGPIGTGKDGILVVGMASLDQVSPWETARGYDLDRNGRIDSRDATFAQMRVWIDLDKDLVMQSKELKTLPEVGIASLVFPPDERTLHGAYENAKGAVYMAGVEQY